MKGVRSWGFNILLTQLGKTTETKKKRFRTTRSWLSEVSCKLGTTAPGCTTRPLILGKNCIDSNLGCHLEGAGKSGPFVFTFPAKNSSSSLSEPNTAASNLAYMHAIHLMSLGPDRKERRQSWKIKLFPNEMPRQLIILFQDSISDEIRVNVVCSLKMSIQTTLGA